MPAILSPSVEKEWLNLESNGSKLSEFLKPFDENRMMAEKIA
jgi:hypothetical protein